MPRPSSAALTMYASSVTSFITGTLTLYNPSQALMALNLPPGASPSVQASSLAAVAMGVFYCLAAYQENRAFFRWSLATRGLTTIWCWGMGGGWGNVAIWEGVGALATVVALVLG